MGVRIIWLMLVVASAGHADLVDLMEAMEARVEDVLFNLVIGNIRIVDNMLLLWSFYSFAVLRRRSLLFLSLHLYSCLDLTALFTRSQASRTTHEIGC